MRRWWAACAAAAALIPALALPGHAADPPATGSPAAGSAVQAFDSCLAERKEGDLLLLFDQSGSLRQTDPTAERVQAANYLLTELLRTTKDIGAQLQVSVAGFDRDYQSTVPWQPLDDGTLPGLRSGVDAYRNRNTGIDTDYVNAVAGAQADLRSRQRDSADTRCQVVVLLSDGQFDIQQRNAKTAKSYGDEKSYAPGVSLSSGTGVAQARAEGQTALCRAGGIADQLRAGGALMFAVGLGQASDFGLLRSVATGTDPGAGACGTANGPVGEFRLAGDVDDLVFALNQYAGGATPTDTTSEVCRAQACPAGSRQFVLDASVRSVDVLAGMSEPGIDVELSSPAGGEPARFSSGTAGAPVSATLAGQQVTGSWVSDRLLQLDLRKVTDAGWTGQWSLVFVDRSARSAASSARTQIRITGDLVPRLVSGSDLQTDQSTAVQLGLASQETGQPVPTAEVLGKASMSATLLAADGTSTTLARGVDLATAQRGVPADLRSFPPGAATLRLLLSVQTRGTTVNGVAVPGTQLADRQVDVPVQVRLPPDYPTAAAKVDFGRLSGVGPVRSGLAVTGPGCVWLAGATPQTGPTGVDARVTSTADSPQSCLVLASGQRATLPLSLGLSAAGNGTVSGLLDVRLAPSRETADRARPARATFVADVARPVKVPVLAGVFVAALLLGLALPLAFLYLVKYLTAKIPGKGLRVGSVPLTVTASEVLRSGAPLTLSVQDTRFLGVPTGGARQLTVEGVELHTRTGWSPTSGAYTEVVAGGQPLVTSTGGGRLPLGVHGSWFFLLTSPQRGEGQLVLLLPSDATTPSYDRTAQQVRALLPGWVQRRRGDASSSPPPADPGAPPSRPSWGSGDAPTPTAGSPSGGWGSAATGGGPAPPSRWPGQSST